MSGNPNANIAPIHRLHPDLLLYIFQMNGDMFADEQALKTTCLASQVCHHWRNFMLETPSLWGRLIDLDVLLDYSATDAWIKELLQRSGRSLLWIKAQRYPVVLSEDGAGALDFLLYAVIRNHWHRIQKMDVKLSLISESIRPDLWALLYQPAPYLETFKLDIWESVDGSDQMATFGPLFDNEAPMLRQYRCKHHPFNSQAPWLRHLCSVDITITLTVYELLAMLQSMPNLECLNIGASVADTTTPLPSVSLPKLNALTLFVNLKAGGILLDHLEIPHNCSLRFYPDRLGSAAEIPEHIFHSVARALANFARRYFQFYPPAKIVLYYRPNVIRFEDLTVSGEHTFVFRLLFASDIGLLPHVITTLLDHLALPELAPAVELRLRILPHTPGHPYFVSFPACLAAVEVLEADEQSLDCLNSVQGALGAEAGGGGSGRVLLPCIRTVKFDMSNRTALASKARKAIFQFIHARQRVGCPVAVLDLTECSRPPELLGSLDRSAPGLTVRWNRSGETLAYVCGSGNPELLP